ncbi:MAG: hypothetical protein ACE5JG_11110, partial [Planctomycetota bacterium]
MFSARRIGRVAAVLVLAAAPAACSDRSKIRKESREEVEAYLGRHPEIAGRRLRALEDLTFEIGVTTKEDFLAIARTRRPYRIYGRKAVAGTSETGV